MAKYLYTGPEQYRPLSPWGYFGYSILFSIPLIALIFMIIYAFDDSNINRRNYARSYFCILEVVLILSIAAAAFGFLPAVISAVGAQI